MGKALIFKQNSFSQFFREMYGDQSGEFVFEYCSLQCLTVRGTQRQFSETICSEDDLRSRIFGKFVVKFLACLPLLGFSNI